MGKNLSFLRHWPGPCCYGHLEGRDAERVYGCDPVDVVFYGARAWRSACWWLVPAPARSAPYEPMCESVQ